MNNEAWPLMRLRAEWLARLRTFFAEQGFLEVETPLLAPETVVDRHIDPIPVSRQAVRGCGASRPPTPQVRGDMAEPNSCLWLQSSPELAMKRLLATPDAPEAIYQITRSFRAGESGAFHNPEFTIVEWYRVGDDYEAGMQLLELLTSCMFPNESLERVRYAGAFESVLGVNPLLDSLEHLRQAAHRARVPLPESLQLSRDRDALLDAIFSLAIQPWLTAKGAALVYDYPASQAALAQIRERPDGSVAERFELFVRGVELANGYHELLDPDELERRTEQANRARTADGKPSLPPPTRLLGAMRSGLPPCSGTAFGFDRALMVIARQKQLQNVLPFPLSQEL